MELNFSRDKRLINVPQEYAEVGPPNMSMHLDHITVHRISFCARIQQDFLPLFSQVLQLSDFR